MDPAMLIGLRVGRIGLPGDAREVHGGTLLEGHLGISRVVVERPYPLATQGGTIRLDLASLRSVGMKQNGDLGARVFHVLLGEAASLVGSSRPVHPDAPLDMGCQ